MKKAIKTTLIMIGVLVVLIIAAGLFAPKLIAKMIYDDNFGGRFETYEPMALQTKDFDGLMREKYTFQSSDGQSLTGYRYYKEVTKPKAVIVLAHGFGGGGHNGYMPVANYFAEHGYLVFAYDATGNDESEGEAVNGLPQGIIDLDHAIRFVKQSEDFSDLPIMLWGHSWGAYAVGSVLALHPDIKAAVMVSGFDKSVDMLESEGRKMAGDSVELVLSDMANIEEDKFGAYANMNCLSGFAATSAKVMIIHSADDDMINKAVSYDVFYEKYSLDPRFQFISYEDRGHNYIFHSDRARAYIDEFNAEFDDYIAGLENGFSPEAKAAYLNQNLDKKQLYELDGELMEQMLELYENCAE